MLTTWTDKVTNKEFTDKINWLTENKWIQEERNLESNIVRT